MVLTGKILTNEDEKLIADFYTQPASDSMVNYYLNREPSFFEALQAEGDDALVYAVIDDTNGRVAGSYIRSVRDCFVNGQPEKVAYLGSMKIHPDYRGGWAFAKMLKSMQQRAYTDPKLHYFSVMADNIHAGSMFLSGRPMLPVVRKVGDFSTRIFKPFRKKINPPWEIVTARETGIKALVAFLNDEGSKRHLFPIYRKEHFEDNTHGWLKGLIPEDILVAVENGKITGTLAVWNQQSFRKWMLYRSTTFRMIQPFVNMYSWIRHMPTIPNGNKGVSCKYLALNCIRNNDPDIFKTLFYYAMNREMDINSNALFVLGHFVDDSMISSLHFPSVELKSNINCFAWPVHQNFLNSIQFNQTYIETGAL
jgi:hypothetical protein